MSARAEFSRLYSIDDLGSDAVFLSATAAERRALAVRFGWLDIVRLEATVNCAPVAGGIEAHGSLRAVLTQPCTVTGAPVADDIAAAFVLRFLDAALALPQAEEVELSADDLDVMPIQDGIIDLGEAVAQELALSVDAFPRSPAADQTLAAVDGSDAAGPFAALKDLF